MYSSELGQHYGADLGGVSVRLVRLNFPSKNYRDVCERCNTRLPSEVDCLTTFWLLPALPVLPALPDHFVCTETLRIYI